MSIRLDPRRLQALKHLAGEAGMRPGDLVRHWVEERIDAQRTGQGGVSLEARLGALEERITGLEARLAAPAATQESTTPEPEPGGGAPADTARTETAPAEEPAPAEGERTRKRRVSAAPAPRVALHDEMIAVLAERGPMTAGELAAAIADRGRYAPPRSGKPLDAAMVSQRASNPTYRPRFVRREGRIGLAEAAE